MAKFNGDFSFTGSLGNISVYKMHGVDRPVARTKGGASKDKIKKDPVFERTRELNAEFAGRSTASSLIMRQIWPQKALGDYNIAGPINALMKPLQDLDTESLPGQRHIMLSKNPYLLQGFSLNRKDVFDSIVRNPVTFSIQRDTLTAQVDIPALLPGINFYMPRNVQQPMYSIIAILGIVPDLFYNANSKKYQPSSNDYIHMGYNVADTGWYPSQKGSPATKLDMKLGITPPDGSFSLVLSVGIRFGQLLDANTVQQVGRAGAARILGMA